MRARLAVLLVLLAAATLVVGFVSSTAWLLYASLVCSALAAISVLLGPRRTRRAELVGGAERDGRNERRQRGARRAGKDEDSMSWAALLGEGEGEGEDEPAMQARRVPAATAASRSPRVAGPGDGVAARPGEADECETSAVEPETPAVEPETPPDGLQTVPGERGGAEPAEAGPRAVARGRKERTRMRTAAADPPEDGWERDRGAWAGERPEGRRGPEPAVVSPVRADDRTVVSPVRPRRDRTVVSPPPGGDYPFPIEDYDDLSVAEILPLLPELDDQELVDVLLREQGGPNRVAVINRIDALLEGEG